MPYWLENHDGTVRLELPQIRTEEQALVLARALYVTSDEPEPWVVGVPQFGMYTWLTTELDGEDYHLVPGGPGGENEFTWVPRE